MSVRNILRNISGMPWRAMGILGVQPPGQAAVSFVVERREWAIRWYGIQIVQQVNAIKPELATITSRPERITGGITHFGSQFMWQVWHPHISRASRIVVTYFHGKPEDGPEMASHVTAFQDAIDHIHCVIVASTQVEQRLLEWGVPHERLSRIPIGVDTRRFVMPTAEARAAARQYFKIPDDCLVIGSFQKDGIGWGNGMEPKMIKGPDLFLDAVERLARNFPVFVLLTGPARGYMATGLEARGIPFTHCQFADYFDIVLAYQALDLYLMTSREEGGPKAILEGAAAGVPVVASRVGMAPDVIVDGTTGFLVEVGDTETTVERAATLLGDPALRGRIATAARENIGTYDWSRIGKAYYTQVYSPLLDLGKDEKMQVV